MRKKNQVYCKDVECLGGIAKKLLTTYPQIRLFAFYGEMGAGKTTFIKSLCEVLQVTDVISSPTFAIINVYQTSDGHQVNHFDCYRIKTIEEVYDIGYEDYFFSGDYCFIEWPENIESLLPEGVIKVTIHVDKNTGARIFEF